MKGFRNFISEKYTFIPKSPDDIKQSTFSNKADLLTLFNLIKKRTNNVIEDPLAIDTANPKKVKIHRSLSGEDLNLKEIGKETNTSLNFGNGSRGNMGASNRGLAFERYLSKDLLLYAQTRNPNGDYKYPIFMREFINKYLRKYKEIEVVDEGALNKPRPLVFKGSDIYVGGLPSDIGATVTDITLKTEKEPLYLSLKMGGTVTFFNSGIKKILPDSDYKKGKITNKLGLNLLDLFAIDPDRFVSIFSEYDENKSTAKGQKQEENVYTKVNIQKLTRFLASGVGYGYYLIHAKSASKDNISYLYLDQKSLYDNVKPESIVVKYPVGGSAKRVDIVIETKMFTFKINIRNKQGGKYPSHIMCDYKIKGH
jgi:hypothetical protein